MLLFGLQDGRMHGHGHYVWADGSEYDGEFHEGYMWGDGKKIWPTGRTYEGEWRKDMMHGDNGTNKMSLAKPHVVYNTRCLIAAILSEDCICNLDEVVEQLLEQRALATKLLERSLITLPKVNGLANILPRRASRARN